MKLVLTDYIASLKEEKELDQLIQDLLREYDFEIVFGPQKGERQYGVDIYAVGSDWEGGQKKLFLITVKQGNLDRANWQGSTQAIEPSLREIISVFIRNNIAPQHKDLPIKIIVAHNGINVSAIQQNFRGFADQYPQYAFDIWQLETLVNRVQEKLINENALSPEASPLLRKIILYLDRPDYDFADYVRLLDDLFGHIKPEPGHKKHNIRQLRKVNFILAIIISYCQKEEDTRLALKASEITLLRFWKFAAEQRPLVEKSVLQELINTLHLRRGANAAYLSKILPVCAIKDGFSKFCGDAVTYTLVVYEHLGFIALAGLELLQLAQIIEPAHPKAAFSLREEAAVCANGVIGLFNNNHVVFTPRADDQGIEVNLAFLLLYHLGRTADLRTLLHEYNNQLGNAKVLSNIAPHFHNHLDEIYELEINNKMRKRFQYKSSTLLTALTEWTAVLDDPRMYEAYVMLKTRAFKEENLLLWYPDENTEKVLYTQKALPNSGYTLSGIKLPADFEAFKYETLRDYAFNCFEVGYSYMEQGLWCISLVASRHYRTSVFPHYWRQFVPAHSTWPRSNVKEQIQA